MGVFSSIGKAFKKVFSGIGKAFKKVLGAVGKALNSKLGKILMAAVSVFTLGTAFIAAQGAYAAASAAGQSFVGAFMEGGKAFVGSLIGKSSESSLPVGGGGKVIKNAGEMAEIGATTEGALAGVDAAANVTSMGGALKPAGSEFGMAAMEGATPGGLLKQGAKLTDTGLADKMLAGGTKAAAQTMPQIAAAGNFGAASQGGGGWLSKAASAAMDFAKSDGGQQIIGSALEGYGRADEMDAYRKIAMRGPRSFREGNPGMKALAAQDYSVDVPNGLAQRTGEATGAAMRRRQARIPYQQQVQGG